MKTLYSKNNGCEICFDDVNFYHGSFSANGYYRKKMLVGYEKQIAIVCFLKKIKPPLIK